jgi:glycerol-3-phosphate acyltransferase PlsY
MSDTQLLLLLIPVGFLAGSIPFGFLVGKARGIDIRTAGSGNIGATNVGRLLGKKWFYLVFFLDVMKSCLTLVAARLLLSQPPQSTTIFGLWLAIGFFALLGHIFTPWLGFKGGKGVATGFGVMLGIFPYYTIPGLIGLATFIAIYKKTRYISLASMIGAGLFPIYYLILGLLLKWDILSSQLPLLVFAFVMASLVILRHRENIARLRAGTENRAPV